LEKKPFNYYATIYYSSYMCIGSILGEGAGLGGAQFGGQGDCVGRERGGGCIIFSGGRVPIGRCILLKSNNF
jgi:hypothetical protein